MAAVDFPDNPATGQTYTFGSQTWSWSGTTWRALANSVTPVISNTAPTGPTTGSLWFNSDTGKLYVYYQDVDTTQWVETGGSSKYNATTLSNFSSIFTTSDLAEGSNLYNTSARAVAVARAAFSVSGNATYDGISGLISINSSVTNNNITSVNSQTGIIVITADNLTEGTNQFFTTARARSALSVTGNGSYNSSTGVITVNNNVAGTLTSVNGKTGQVVLTTADIAENTNLYYTDARARGAFSVTGQGTYNASTGVVNLTTDVYTYPRISSISITDSGYALIDDTAVNTAGGYIKILGQGFTAGSQVIIGTTLASSVSVVAATELQVQTPALSANTYTVYVVGSDGSVAIRLNALTTSPIPIWGTSSTLATTYINTPISIQLSAPSNSTVTYTVVTGTTLPPGLALSGTGLLSGTVTTPLTTIYSFSVLAVDLEQQDATRTFNISIIATDTYFSYTSLLLKNTSAVARNGLVTDSSVFSTTTPRTGTPSTGWISPYQTRGYWSVYFGGSGNYLYTNTAPITTTTTTFTIECWIYPIVTAPAGTPGVVADGDTGNTGTYWAFGPNSSSLLNFYWWTGSANNVTGNTTISLSVWTHIAISVNANAISMYVNGVQQTLTGTTTLTNRSGSFNYIKIGNSGSATFFTGYVSNLSVLNGTAKYSTGFTPTITPLNLNTTNQTLLVCFGNRFVDSNTATTAKTITVVGSPLASPTFYPSNFTAPADSIGAAFFTTTDSLVTAPNPQLALIFGDFTIEFWAYVISAANGTWIFRADNGGGYSGLMFYSNGTNWLIYATTNSGNWDIFNAVSLVTIASTLNVWTHFAVSRAGSAFKVFINGVQITTATSTGKIYQTAYRMTLNASTSSYISNFRLVRAAVYTGTFTPPRAFVQTTGLSSSTSYDSTTNVNVSFPAYQTSLLLNFNDVGTTATRTLADGSGNNLAVSKLTTTIRTNDLGPFRPTGYWSTFFNGYSDLYTISNLNAFLTTGPFTIEAWILPMGGSVIIDNSQWYQGNNCGWSFSLGGVGDGKLYLSASNAVWNTFPNVYTSVSTVTFGVWSHVAIVRNSSNVIRGYIDGNDAGGSVTYSASLSQNVGTSFAGTRVGGGSLADGVIYGYFPGFISNLRLVNGVGVYTGAFTPSVTGLTATQSAGTNISAITGTATLILTFQDRIFKENGSNANAYSVSGSPQITPYSPNTFTSITTERGSGYFNGSTDYLLVAPNPLFAFGTGDFTMEAWVYQLSRNSYAQIAGPHLYGVSAEWLWTITSSGNLFLQITGSGTGAQTSSGVVPLAVWTHVVVVRLSGNVTFYINGAASGTGSYTTSVTNSSTPLGIGAASNINASSTFNGYISNLRIVKGTAVYTGAFTAPVANLTADGATSATSYPSTTNVNTTFTGTSLLLNFQDSNTALVNTSNATNSVFIDRSQYVVPITRVGTGTQGAFTPYRPNGYWSAYFNDGSNYATIPNDASLDLSTGDFTVECWFNTPVLRSPNPLIYRFNGNSNSFTDLQFAIGLDNANIGATVYYGNAPNTIASVTGAVSIGVWNHCALVRTGNNFYFYFNGTRYGSLSSASSLSNSSWSTYFGFWRGGNISYPAIVTLSNVRIVKGTALYTNANESVPTAPLTAITNTSFLGFQTNRLKDNSTNNFTITPSASGVPIIRAYQPFNLPSAYSVTNTSGSGYFAGAATDYLTVPNNPNFEMGVNDYTLELWYYATVNADAGLVFKGTYTVGNWPSPGFGIRRNSNTSLGYYFNTTTTGAGEIRYDASSVSNPENTWHHVAMVVKGGIGYAYLNGVLLNAGGRSGVGTLPTSTDGLMIGRFPFSGANIMFTGYMSGIRIVKGTAVYSGAFTPPSVSVVKTSGSASAASYPSTTNVNTTFIAAQTSLLLPFDNGGFYDAANQADIIVSGDVVTNSTITKFSGTSMYFDGSGDYLSFPSNPGYAFGTGDFTIEAWVYSNDVSGAAQRGWIQTSDTAGGLKTSYTTGVVILFGAGAAGVAFTGGVNTNVAGTNIGISSAVVTAGTWNHIAVSRTSGTVRIFVNGTMTVSGTAAGSCTGTYLAVGGYYNTSYLLDGYIQDLRITTGYSRYTTTTLSVPTVELLTQ